MSRSAQLPGRCSGAKEAAEKETIHSWGKELSILIWSLRSYWNRGPKKHSPNRSEALHKGAHEGLGESL